ncbi:hypothetical protein [Pontibacter kalidii]|uniref:hypothetical protein n=1 Tax=Pontibacter kalidii TaxID=2592049 RepID=UPI00224E79E4|nr:hypothetical protein [Pontibacter kalidii]
MKYVVALAMLFFSCTFISCTYIPTGLGNTDTYPKYEQSSKFKKIFLTPQGYTFAEYYLIKQFTFNNQLYSARVRVYNEANVDTAYFRENKEGVVYIDPKTFIETVDLPKDPKPGQKWQEPTNWVYEVKSIDATLETPIKNWSNLIEIEAKQTTGETKDKFMKYSNFYAEGIGFVGSIVDNELIAFFKEKVDIAQSKE